MALEIYQEYMICKHYIYALINDDYSGLNDNDIKAIDHFDRSLPANHTIDISDFEVEFCEDHITGLMADCVEVTIWTLTNITPDVDPTINNK